MPKIKPRVVYWLNQPTPYFVGRLNALADRGTIHIEAWFREERQPDRSWAVNPVDWRFPACYLPERKLLGMRNRIPLQELRQARPDLFIQECDRGYQVAGFLAARALARRVAFRALPNFDAWSQRTWWREAGKHFVHRAVDALKTGGPDGIAQAVAYGLPSRRAYAVAQTIDLDLYGRSRTITAETRHYDRLQFGLKGCVFIYVGRLWSGKGLDYLFDAYRQVQTKIADISLLLVGDGVDEARYRTSAGSLPGIVFAGFVQPKDLPRYYALADVMVFPTLGDPHGLVVEEALTAGLPVICTNAAGDIRQRIPEQVGFVVPVANAASLAERMLQLASDASLRQHMAAVAPQLTADLAHDRYAHDFERFVYSVLAKRPRATIQASFARRIGLALIAIGTNRSYAPVRYVTQQRRGDQAL